MGEEHFTGGKQRMALFAGVAALLASAFMGLLALLGFGSGVFAPCDVERLECTASTSTKIEAIGSLPLAAVAVAGMLAVGVFSLRAAFRFSPDDWRDATRYLKVSGAATALWIAWFVIYPAESSPVESQPDPLADCIATTLGPEPGAVLLSRVVLVGYGTPEMPLGSELPSTPHGDGRFAKIGLQVQSTAPVTLTVPSSAADVTANWQFGHADPPSKSVTVSPQGSGPCAEYSWFVFPGGFHYERSHCLALRLEVDGGETIVPVGLGKDCDGVRTG